MEKIRNFVTNLSPGQYGILWLIWFISSEILGIFTRQDVLNDKITNVTIKSNIAFSIILSLYSIFLIYALIIRKKAYKNKQLICPACGYEGRTKIETPGNLLTEALLWSLIIPGIIYTLWRQSSRYRLCSSCGGRIKNS